MKKRFWGKAIAMFAGAFCAATLVSVTSEAALKVVAPTELSVYQREVDDYATPLVQATYDGEGTVQARRVVDGKADSEWITLIPGLDKVYTGKLPKTRAGLKWFSVEVQVVKEGDSIDESKKIEKVAVGDVFLTTGQSNSANFGGKKMKAESEFVSAYDVKNSTWVHCEDAQPNTNGYVKGNEEGSCWPSAGDAYVKKAEVAVGFVTTGVGSAKIEELRKNHYPGIKNAINALKPYGIRAVLLHQGEADTDGTDRKAYVKSLKGLIAQTREDAGYDLPWFIAKVSYAWSNYNNKEKMESMVEAQKSVCNNYDIFEGPTTDDLLGDYRRKADNLHLSEKGLIEHGTRWANILYRTFSTVHKVNLLGSTTGGKVNFQIKAPIAASKVEFSIEPDEGYVFVPGSFTVNGVVIDTDKQYFSMPNADATVKYTFVQEKDYKSELDKAIAEAEKVDLSTYDEASVNAFKAAIEDAKKVTGEDATVENIDKAIKAMLSTKAGLTVFVPDPTPAPTKTPKPTAKPTAKPTVTPAATVAPTEVPVVEPTAAPVDNPLVTPAADTVKVAKVSGLKAKVKKLKATLTWKKVAGVKGYQVVYSTDKKVKKSLKKLNVKKNTAKTAKLKKGKKYYVKVRAYIVADGKKVYGSYSRVVSFKAK